MEVSKKGRGRPKLPWDPYYGAELWKRLTTGAALSTVQEEADYLEKWGLANKNSLPAPPLKLERIRERIKKRYHGSEGYRQARSFHRHALGLGD